MTAATGHNHPGIVAQAFVTLEEIHDGRVVLGLSTGEAMNETALGFDWPDYPVHRDRLEELLEIIHDLWNVENPEEFVSYDGDSFGWTTRISIRNPTSTQRFTSRRTGRILHVSPRDTATGS